MKTKLLFLVVSLMVSVPALGQENVSVSWFEGKINKIQTFKSNFRQEYFDSFQQKTTISEGMVLFAQPGYMRWVYQKPDELLIVVGEEKIWVYDSELENVTIQSSRHVRAINTLRFLSKSNQLSSRFTKIHTKRNLLDKNPKFISIHLAPKDKNQNYLELQLALNRFTNRIEQFVVIDLNHNYRKISFYRMKVNIKIDPSVFYFEVTDGMEVIDGVND